MMMTRRALMLSAAAAFLLARLPARAQTAASGFVQDFGSRLVEVVNGDGSMPEKEQRLRPLIDRAVDVDGIARFCLGRFATGATPQQVSEFTRLFHDVLLNNIVSKIGEYRGVSFRLVSEAQRGEDAVVVTVVQRPNNAPNNVRWVVSTAGGGDKIVDVVAEGTSLRLTQRSDYAAYMSQHNNNLDSLIQAMRTQISQGG